MKWSIHIDATHRVCNATHFVTRRETYLRTRGDTGRSITVNGRFTANGVELANQPGKLLILCKCVREELTLPRTIVNV
jgi:hypothetical protein